MIEMVVCLSLVATLMPSIQPRRNRLTLSRLASKNGEVNLEEAVDDRFIRKVHESGFLNARMGNEYISGDL